MIIEEIIENKLNQIKQDKERENTLLTKAEKKENEVLEKRTCFYNKVQI